MKPGWLDKLLGTGKGPQPKNEPPGTGQDRSVDVSGGNVGAVVTGDRPSVKYRHVEQHVEHHHYPPQEQKKLHVPLPADERARDIFIGRTDELACLEEALLGKDPAAVAITAIEGMAGVGKSYLADHFALVHEHRFSGYEVLPVDPVSPQTPEALLEELAGHLKTAADVDMVRAVLQAGPFLLHLENVDSPEAAETAGRVAAWFKGCPLIMTGRMEGLGRGRGQMVVLRPFSVEEGVEQLFEELAFLGADPVSEADARSLAKALAGLPLALHLAAGYIAAGYTTSEFLENLDAARLALPPEGALDSGFSRDPRRLTLASAFGISLDALARRQPDRAPAFVSLGFLPAAGFGTSLGAAAAEMEESSARLLFEQARKLSLLERLRSGPDAPARWQLHPLLAAHLRNEADGHAVRERVAAWFMARLPEPENDDYAPWLELNAEHPALIVLLKRTPAEQGPALVSHTQYGILNGPWSAWAAFCEKVLAIDPDDEAKSNALWLLANCRLRLGQPEEALSAAETNAELERERGAERLFALARGIAADIHQARGELDEALRIREQESLPVYERLGDVRSRAVTMGQIADIYQARGELDEALRIREQESLPVYERLGDVRSRAVTMGQIADIYQARGELDEALRIREQEELPVYERLGDVRERAVTMGKIADIYQARGELDEALRIREQESLPVYERLGDVRSRAVTMGQIADIYQARGELDEALRIREQEELPVYERLGDVRERAVTMGKIADIYQARGELDEALRICEQEELPVYERLGDVRSRAVTMGQIADIYQARGELDEALRILKEEVFPACERLGDVRSRAVTMGKIADIYQARGELDEALRIREQEELPVYERLGDVRSRAVTMGKIADIYQARGELDEALRIREQEELPVYERLGDVRERAVTMGKIADIYQARGELDEALRIREQESLPVYERLGDVRSRAVTMGQIADIYQARGELDEALRIREQESLPVYERLGDVRERAVTMGKIADIYQARGELDEALRIREQEELPVYERLGAVRDLLVGRANLAILCLRMDPPRIEKANRLLCQAFAAARRMNIPEEKIIRGILEKNGMTCDEL